MAPTLPSFDSFTKTRRLVLCIDGADDDTDSNSNMYQLFRSLNTDDQLTKYLTGPGIPLSKGVFRSRLDNLLDLDFARFQKDRIIQGYKWLADRYQATDEIFLFGFSRGAQLVRCIAGMIDKIGLICRAPSVGLDYPLTSSGTEGPVRNIPEEVISNAYSELYLDETVHGILKSSIFKGNYSFTSIPIKFVGCWDTVVSVGLLAPHHPPFAASTKIIEAFRHALSLDEHGARFKKIFWQKVAPNPKLGIRSRFKPGGEESVQTAIGLQAGGYPQSRPETDVREVWFAGSHSDVGGASVMESSLPSLSRPALRWMMREAARSGLKYNETSQANEPVTEIREPPVLSSAVSPPAGSSGGRGRHGLSGVPSTPDGLLDSATAPIPSDILDALKPICDERNPKVVADSTKTDFHRLCSAFGWGIPEDEIFYQNPVDVDGPWLRRWLSKSYKGGIVKLPTSRQVAFHYSVWWRMGCIGYLPRTRFYVTDAEGPEMRHIALGSDCSHIQWVYDS